MPKTLDEYFCDWEGEAFGYGYGTGEPHTLAALKIFIESLEDRFYDYTKLETLLGPTAAWLLINALCKDNTINYGTSPRFAWIDYPILRDYVNSHTLEELIDIVCNRENRENVCYKTACNCGPNGYDKNAVCANPFWGR